MGGIYIHIPFCRKACHYCNFHFSTNLSRIDPLIDSICSEIKLRRDFLKGEAVETIYFGGGTPSLLNEVQLTKIFKAIRSSFDISKVKEVTIEINPEDVQIEVLKVWRNLGVNRLSIGVQSFHDIDLEYMNRAHDVNTAHRAIQLSKKEGFDNISIDLIFGAHTTKDEMWVDNINHFIDYDLNHLSAYGLTVEENTALSHFIKTGKLPDPDEGRSVRQFNYCMETLEEKGLIHYEISNYGKDGCFSKHNTNYWQGVPYIGIGPAAHSFDGQTRYWNISNNQKYIKAIEENDLPLESEVLSIKDKFNEYLMTGLRFYKGIDLAVLKTTFPQYKSILEDQIEVHMASGNVVLKEDNLYLTKNGKLISDHVISDFFAIEN